MPRFRVDLRSERRAVPIRLRETHSFQNPHRDDLEFLIVGITLEKEKFDVTDLR